MIKDNRIMKIIRLFIIELRCRLHWFSVQ